jgi:Intracellular proteinase inhibitor
VVGVRRLVVLALITAVAGCGAGGDSSEHKAGKQKQGLVLSASFGELKSGSPVTWKLEVENAGPDEATLVFRSGKDGDVALLRDGRETYRWSGDKYFSQAMRQVHLKPGERKTFSLEEKALSAEPGDYELVADLDSQPAPPAARRSAKVKSR